MFDPWEICRKKRCSTVLPVRATSKSLRLFRFHSCFSMDKDGKTRTPMEWSFLNRSDSSTTLAQLTHPTQTNHRKQLHRRPPNKLQLFKVSILAIPTPAVYLQWLWHPPVPVMFRSVPPSASEKMAGRQVAQGGHVEDLLCKVWQYRSQKSNGACLRQAYVNMCTLHYQLYIDMWYV